MYNVTEKELMNIERVLGIDPKSVINLMVKNLVKETEKATFPNHLSNNKITSLIEEGVLSFEDLGFVQYLLDEYTEFGDNYIKKDGEYLTKSNLIEDLRSNISPNECNSASYLKKKIAKLEKRSIIMSEPHVDDRRNKVFYISPLLFDTNNSNYKNEDNELNKKETRTTLRIVKNSKFIEKELENMLIKDLSVIEDGLVFIGSQYPVNKGFIDVLARDRNNKLCIIELKNAKRDTKLIEQCVYYPTQFDEEIRMITIAPDYGNKLRTSLEYLGYVEMKTFELTDNGIIIKDY